jgi:hypothetical protein
MSNSHSTSFEYFFNMCDRGVLSILTNRRRVNRGALRCARSDCIWSWPTHGRITTARKSFLHIPVDGIKWIKTIPSIIAAESLTITDIGSSKIAD